MENLLKDVKELLDFDPIDAAEKIVSPGTDPSTIGFLLNRRKQEILKQMLEGFDTYFGASFQETIDVLKSIGFKLEYQEHFKMDKNPKETLQIYVHERYTMFAVVESHSGTSLNRCYIYFLVRRPSTKEEWDQFISVRMSHDSWDEYDREKKETIEKQEIVCELDGREGLKIILSTLKEFLSTNPIPRKPFLWLLNYQETKKKEVANFTSDWYYERSLEKLLKCKSHKRIIGWEIPKRSLFQKIKEKFKW